MLTATRAISASAPLRSFRMSLSFLFRLFLCGGIVEPNLTQSQLNEFTPRGIGGEGSFTSPCLEFREKAR